MKPLFDIAAALARRQLYSLENFERNAVRQVLLVRAAGKTTIESRITLIVL
jgi:hypothetical protein